MIIFFLLFAVLCLWKIKFSRFQDGYMAKEQTTDIKGIFAIIILFSHLRGYTPLSNSFLDQSFSALLGYIGQLMVTMFFFYSGYGILKSYTKKDGYAKSFFTNRLLKTLLHFDIAVFCYLCLSIALSLVTGSFRTWQDYAFCWIGWTSIGNSNWFIFTMLALYAVTLLAFPIAYKFNKNKGVALTIAVSILCVPLWIALYFTKESWWYNTLFCYPLGMCFALVQDKMDEFLKKSPWIHYGGIALVFALFVTAYIVSFNQVIYSLTACLFCLALTLITTKVKVGNPVLTWLGKASFSIYIFQRLPMIVLSAFDLWKHRYVFTILSIIATIICAFIFEWFYKVIDGFIFGKRKTKPASEPEKSPIKNSVVTKEDPAEFTLEQAE